MGDVIYERDAGDDNESVGNCDEEDKRLLRALAKAKDLDQRPRKRQFSDDIEDEEADRTTSTSTSEEASEGRDPTLFRV